MILQGIPQLIKALYNLFDLNNRYNTNPVAGFSVERFRPFPHQPTVWLHRPDGYQIGYPLTNLERIIP